MPDAIHTIGLLASGGDCPGLNAVIRAVIKSATVGSIAVSSSSLKGAV